MKLNDKNIETAIEQKEDLEYMITRFRDDGLEYVNLENLEKAKDELEKDITEYKRIQKTQCPALQIGAIIRIDGGDGISYGQRDYYKITGITETHIHFDHLVVVRGDFGNEVRADMKAKELRENWIVRYNQNYHKDNISEDEWKEILVYTENVPWLK